MTHRDGNFISFPEYGFRFPGVWKHVPPEGVSAPKCVSTFSRSSRNTRQGALCLGQQRQWGEAGSWTFSFICHWSLWWGACVTGNTWGQGCMSGFSHWSGVGPSSVSKQLLPAVTQGLPWSPHLSKHPHKFTIWGLPWWFSGKESACQCRRHGFNPRSGRIPHASEQVSPHATTTEPVF